jgi:tetratricopeptide (TPR) repeat protein
MHADARGCLLGALDACREVGDSRFEAAILHALGENALAARDAEQARSDFTEALELRRKIGYRPGVCETLLALGQLAAMTVGVEAARPYLEEATELAPALNMPAIAALARATAALLFAKEGRRDRARTELQHAQDALAAAGPLSVSSRAEGLYFAALAARALGDEEAYRTHMQEAWRTVQAIAEHLPPDQRKTFLTGASPNREIVAAAESL